MKRTLHRESMMAPFICAVHEYICLYMGAFYTYGYICVCFVYVVIYSCILYGNNETQWKEDYSVKAHSNLRLRGARIHMSMHGCFQDIWLYMCLLCICVETNETRGHAHPAVEWEPWVRSVHMGIYVSVLCMWLYIHVFCIATLELNGKNTITWMHDGNLYLCGARIHMSIHGCFLYI